MLSLFLEILLATLLTALVDASAFEWDAIEVPETAEATLRTALMAGTALEVTEKVNDDGEGAKSFAQVLLSDVVANPYVTESTGFIQLGLWQKIHRTSKKALKRARGDAAPVEIAFQDIYMGKLTEHFGNDIDRLRQTEDPAEPFDEFVMANVVEALQSHSDMFTEGEKTALISVADQL